MPEKERRAHGAVRKLITEFVLLYDANGEPIRSEHPDRDPAIRKVRARLHQAVDEEMDRMPAKDLGNPGKLEQAVRGALRKARVKTVGDLGKGEIYLPDLTLPGGKKVVRFTLPVYKLVTALAALLAGLKLKEWIRAPQLAGSRLQAGTVRRNASDGLEYVWIPPGTFLMGAVPGDDQALRNERPRHRVRISKGFWLGRGPVTVATYKRYVAEAGREMPEAPEFNQNWDKADHPVVRVNWGDAQKYSRWSGGRLPTEAEWEYAARGGKEGWRYPWGDGISHENANYGGSKWKGTSPVGSCPPNTWGLYDMAGNVWEWVADWYGEDFYGESVEADPIGPERGESKVVRGGSCYGSARDLRAAGRVRDRPGERGDFVGFRCAREVVP